MRSMSDGPQERYLFPGSIEPGDEIFYEEGNAWLLVTDVRKHTGGIASTPTGYTAVELLVTVRPEVPGDFPRPLRLEKLPSDNVLVRRFHW